MKEIPLTKGYFAIVDDEEEAMLSKYNWYASCSDKNKELFYAAATIKSNPQKRIYMHRLIMNTPKGMLCDHINSNTLDNRKSNLRNCNQSQNQMNSKAQINNKLGLKNICLHRKNRFAVNISKNGKWIYRKTFKHLEDAIKARDEQLKIHHGEFAKTK